MSMNANTKNHMTTASDPTIEELEGRYDAWRGRFDQYEARDLILLITNTSKYIAEHYPHHSRGRKLMLKKLEAMQDSAVARMS